MRSLWAIRCTHCGTGKTIGIAPGLPGFIKIINCSICNKKIDASLGFYILQPIQFKKESFDLLSVE